MDLGVHSNSVSTDQLRSLDPTLGFSLTIQEHHDLMIQSTGASISGILKSLESTEGYAQSIQKFNKIVDSLREGIAEAKRLSYRDATAQEVQGHKDAVMADFYAVVDQAKSPISGWKSQISTLRNNLNYSDSRAVADQLTNAVNAYQTALNQARNGNPNSLQSAVNQLSSARQAVQSRYSTVSSQLTNALNADPQDSALITSLSAERNRLDSLRSVASSIVNRADSDAAEILSPSNEMYFKTPTVYAIASEYTLATWGNSGSFTVVDKNGNGLRIHSSGDVDIIGNPDGEWKVSGKTSFIFAGDLKVTLNPGSPARILAILGNQVLRINDMKNPPAADANPSPYGLGGRKLDANNSDGQVIQFKKDNPSDAQARWISSASGSLRVLGDGNTREVLATGQNTEARVDGVDIEIPEELTSYFAELELTVPDMDGDGRLNELEIQQLSFILDEVMRLYQDMHAASLLRVAEANAALMELTDFMAKLQSHQDDEHSEDMEMSAAEREELRTIEDRLNKAIQAMNVEEQSLQSIGQAALRNASLNQTVSGTATSPSGESTQVPSGASVIVDGGDARFSRASRLLGTSLQAQNLLVALQASSSNPTEALKSLEGVMSWLGMGQGEITPAQVQAGLELLIELAGSEGASEESLAALNGFLAFVATQGEGLSFSVSAGLLQQLQALGLSESEIASLTAALVKADISLDGSVPAVLSEAGLTSLFAMLQGAPSAQRGEVLGKLNAFLGAVNSLENAEFKAAFGAWPNVQGNANVQDAWNQFATSLGSLPGTAGFVPQAWLGQSVSAGAYQSGFDLLKGLSQIGQQSSAIQAGGDTQARDLALGMLGTWTSGSGAVGSLGLLGWIDPSATSVTDEVEQARQGALHTIFSNIVTPEQLLRRLEQNLNQATEFYKIQMREAENLFVRSQDVVKEFFAIIKRDDLGKDVIKSDVLSDEQQAAFERKMAEFRKELGIDWGSSETAGDPAQESKRVSRMMQSGMMV